jgi:adenine phosphoribosyltransferase
MDGSALAAPDGLDGFLRSALRDVRDFPIDGIMFKDIAPLLARRGAVSRIAAAMAPAMEKLRADAVMAIDARGFILGAVLADRLGAALVLVRKPGKLPGAVQAFDYTCEYCSGRLEVTEGALAPGQRVLVVDDVLATGGTARATADFAQAQGAVVAGYGFLLEIAAIGGRSRLADAPVTAILRC